MTAAIDSPSLHSIPLKHRPPPPDLQPISPILSHSMTPTPLWVLLVPSSRSSGQSWTRLLEDEHSLSPGFVHVRIVPAPSWPAMVGKTREKLLIFRPCGRTRCGEKGGGFTTQYSLSQTSSSNLTPSSQLFHSQPLAASRAKRNVCRSSFVQYLALRYTMPNRNQSRSLSISIHVHFHRLLLGFLLLFFLFYTQIKRQEFLVRIPWSNFSEKFTNWLFLFSWKNSILRKLNFMMRASPLINKLFHRSSANKRLVIM